MLDYPRLLTALEKTSPPTRTRLQQTLSNPNFQATGATGRIRFQPNGDRKNPQIQLIQVQQAKQGQSVFVPLSTIPEEPIQKFLQSSPFHLCSEVFICGLFSQIHFLNKL